MQSGCGVGRLSEPADRQLWADPTCGVCRTIGSMPSMRPRPLTLRWMVVAAVAGAVVGCVVGIVVGLIVHWRTAWFAVFELGVPASILGGLLGLICGAFAWAIQQTVRNGRHD